MHFLPIPFEPLLVTLLQYYLVIRSPINCILDQQFHNTNISEWEQARGLNPSKEEEKELVVVVVVMVVIVIAVVVVVRVAVVVVVFSLFLDGLQDTCFIWTTVYPFTAQY
jgi:sterol desaturase/sphingolipid hydroxylase (fatty acid hydroxylase superfamily)